jgi:peptide/nickel transport system permease protein
MTAYLIRRVLIGVVTLFVITTLLYVLIRNIPGTPLTMNLAEVDLNKKISDEDIELLNQAYGLDKKWYIAYRDWLFGLFVGDLGNSFRYRTPVAGLIAAHLRPTLLLAGSSLAITYLLSIPLGLYMTRNGGRWNERAMSVLFYMLYSLPTYVAAIWLLYYFYFRFQGTIWQLPPGMVSDNHENLSPLGQKLDIAKHLILPLFCYSYGALAFDTRFIKSNMEEVIRQDYIRTARAKGLDDRTILWKHAFRNTLIPFVTLIGYSLPGLVSGAVILEQIFNWPGIGHLFFEAVTFRDYPLIMGLTLMFSIVTLLGNLLADILYAFVDPRITYQ